MNLLRKDHGTIVDIKVDLQRDAVLYMSTEDELLVNSTFMRNHDPHIGDIVREYADGFRVVTPQKCPHRNHSFTK